MITIGLTTWTDHPALINNENRKVKLNEYTGFLPTVEVDNPFYGVPRVTTVEKWREQVPDDFQFILKANQYMTRHDLRTTHPADPEKLFDVFKNFKAAMQPLVSNHQLKTILFQFPPFFQRNNDNIRYLREIRSAMGNLPITIEFRHPSWYNDNLKSSIIDYLKRLKMTLAIVDEPHNLNGGVPFEPVITNPSLVLFRLHGRNSKGWFQHNRNWRSQRTLYRYNDQQLHRLADVINKMRPHAKEICVIFNNNSGKDAAPNALKLKQILNLHFHHLAPSQLNLF
ncbi:hypothetical protein WR164_12130 [Philodulcilactobacillus myokoensis]|uniref:DUF72 domain-containing protein n=1 Tax=Philodulcilactobacillus myokoensis TaxID=2929573 RepID=A0A9W6B3N4_9LACO|nr:DUF72 domain-containing protein [Philodulcilactobacillus myokoensis]GLB47234.1 hypothetical protein WR164_12130 [Philodulcilactobacillus myokoensis]